MSSPARPEPDGVRGADAEGGDGGPVDPGPPLDPHQMPPAPVPPDNTVTTIMPVIAPWPEPAPPPDVQIPPLLAPPRRPRAAEPPPAPPARAHEIVTAELAELAEPEPPGPRSAPAVARVPAAASLPADQSTGAGFADALLVSANDETAGAEIRPGPTVLAADSWDVEPVAPVPEETYAGRRRAYAVSRRVWIAIAVVLVGLGAVAVVPFALSNAGGPDRTTALPAGGNPADQAEGDVPAISALESSTPDSVPRATAAATGGSTAAPGAPAPTTSTTSLSAPTTQAAAALPQPATSNPPPFAPVTFEAEAGTLTGSARVFDLAGASGGRVIANVGLWFGAGTAGTVQINGVNLPSDGRYTVTIYYVHLNGETTRSATVTVSGAAPITTSFTGTSTCCQTKVLANISLSAGVHTILIANPNGHAPSIDKVVVSRS